MLHQDWRGLARSLYCCLLSAFLTTTSVLAGQVASRENGLGSPTTFAGPAQAELLDSGPGKVRVSSVARYFDAAQGVSSGDAVRRALTSNGELAAARLEVDRAIARIHQAGLRPNPRFDFEQSAGRLAGSVGDRGTSIGLELPLEVGGKRQRRIDLAKTQLEAAEAEIADRERRLTVEVQAAYVAVLASLRELEITEQMNNNDAQTARIVEARVIEGESAPLELSLIRAEVDRLRSQRALAEGRVEAALLRLKSLTGIPPEEPLRLNETLMTTALTEPPPSIEQTIDIALRSRPDLQLARLNERVAEAALRSIRAEAIPDVTVSARYSFDRSLTELPDPLSPFPDTSRRLSFGVSLELPLANRNQGARAEALAAMRQAQRRREFAEQLVRYEVAGAQSRYEASRTALATFEQGVLGRSTQNINMIRQAYRLGAFRVTEVLAEQRRLIDLEREYILLLTERHRALIDLHSAMASAIR